MDTTSFQADWVALNSDWPALLVIGLYAVTVWAVWRQRPPPMSTADTGP
jgi:hypothetical protein